MTNLNKNIKCFFVDLDGTLLDTCDGNGDLTISNDNISQIKQTSKEKEVVISTGRYGPFVKKCLKLINGRFAVMANGALVEDHKGNVLKEVKMLVRQNLLVWNIAKQHKLIIKTSDNNTTYGVNSRLLKRFINKKGFFTQNNYNLDTHKKYHKCILWTRSKLKSKKIQEELNAKVKDLSIAIVAKGFALEITHKDATKLSGNLKVAELLNLSKNQVMHIGDSMNDASTVKGMRLVAMKNSPKELKKRTPYIGPHYKNAGVAKVLLGQYTKI